MGPLDDVVRIVGSVRFLVGFVCGALSVLAYTKAGAWWDRRHGRRTVRVRMKMTWLVGGLLTLFIVNSMMATYTNGRKAETSLRQSEQTATEAKAFAETTRRCQLEVLAILKDRSDVASVTDRIALERDIVMMDWMHRWLFPPPEIAARPTTDPVRQAWKEQSTAQADAAIRELIVRQREQDAQRAANPYPAPQYCGN